jgi:hypothetical protein
MSIANGVTHWNDILISLPCISSTCSVVRRNALSWPTTPDQLVEEMCRVTAACVGSWTTKLFHASLLLHIIRKCLVISEYCLVHEKAADQLVGKNKTTKITKQEKRNNAFAIPVFCRPALASSACLVVLPLKSELKLSPSEVGMHAAEATEITQSLKEFKK